MDGNRYENMCTFCHNIFKKSYVEGMLYGNLSLEEAKNTSMIIDKVLQTTPYPPSRHFKVELAALPKATHPSYLVLESEHPANALILTADCGDFSFKRGAALEILSKGLEEPFFSELRTRQQTAYLVSNWSQEIERHLYSFFAIQSSSHDTRDLLARFELFLESSLQNLSDGVIPRERFEAIRRACIQRLEKPAENLQNMGSLLNTLAFDYDGDFEWIDKQIRAIKSLTYEEFEMLTKEFLGKDNLRRLAVCVNGSLPPKKQISYRQITTTEKIRDKISYKGRE